MILMLFVFGLLCPCVDYLAVRRFLHNIQKNRFL